jgi:hypothetical protein
MRVGRSREGSGTLPGFAGRVLMLAGMAALLILVLGQLPVPSPGGVAVSAAFAPLDLNYQVFLPLLMRPEEPTLTIHDLEGVEQDWDWLSGTFGAVTLQRGIGGASVRELSTIEGPSTLVVRVEDAHGDPLEGVPVVFYWPDAPSLLPEQQACGLDRGIVGLSKSNGNAEFGMGGGAYYFPPDERGPHSVWVVVPGGSTDCLGGLGMLGGTNHIHLDSVWRLP